MLEFKPITDYERGTISAILLEGFADFLNDEVRQKIAEDDREAFDNPNTVGACFFITTLNDEVVGMASYDPRQGPEQVIIGWNCILPKFQGRGFGKEQIKKLLYLFHRKGYKKVSVTTGDHPGFIPAQKMYLACGFTEARRYEEGRDPRFDSIDYELTDYSTLEELKTWIDHKPL